MYNKNEKKINNTIIVLFIIILILLYLLIQKFGYIQHYTPSVPTGNVDIFEIDCPCCNDVDKIEEKKESKEEKSSTKSTSKLKKNNKSVFKEINDNNDINKDKVEDSETKDFVVYDNYKIWDNKELRIFSNPAYEFENIIAPGSSNSYAFVIRNNNDFDIIVDIIFEEINESHINMNYKLTNNSAYLLGTKDNYESITNKRISNINIPAKNQKSYILYWKWIDSDNDTEVGFNNTSNYKLSISIGVK